MENLILEGDCLEKLKELPDGIVDCCVTSPPYYGLRDYGTGTWVGGDPNCNHEEAKYSICPRCGAVREDMQIGLEDTPEEYVEKLVSVFREVRRVLKDDGTLSTMRKDNRVEWFGTTSALQILAENNYAEFESKIREYKRSLTIPRLGDVVEYHRSRYLVVKIDDESYHLLSGRSFEVICVGKDYEKEIIRMNDWKDLDRLSKAVKGET